MQLFELWMLPKKVCRPGVNVEEHLVYIIPWTVSKGYSLP